MNVDELITYGIKDPQGVQMLKEIREKNLSFHQIGERHLEMQKSLSTYGKGRLLDQIQLTIVRHCTLLETLAWRLYMVGSGAQFKIQKRTNPAYWKMKNLIGEKKADKWLKKEMRKWWEHNIWKHYVY